MRGLVVVTHWGKRKEKVISLGTFRGSCDLQKRNKNSATGCPLSTQGGTFKKMVLVVSDRRAAVVSLAKEL